MLIDDRTFAKLFGCSFVLLAVWVLVCIAAVVTGIALLIRHFG